MERGLLNSPEPRPPGEHIHNSLLCSLHGSLNITALKTAANPHYTEPGHLLRVSSWKRPGVGGDIPVTGSQITIKR